MNESLPKIGIENETVRFLLSKKELKSARALSSCQGYLKIVGDDDNYPFFVFLKLLFIIVCFYHYAIFSLTKDGLQGRIYDENNKDRDSFLLKSG